MPKPKNCCTDLIEAFGKKECFEANKTVAKEGGLKFSIEKKNDTIISTCKVHVDDCLIQGSTVRCDFLFKICNTGNYYFIEFKGQDVKHAYKQIVTTIKALSPKLKIDKNNIFGIIVTNRAPALGLGTTQLLEDFRKDIGGRLIIKNETYTVTV